MGLTDLGPSDRHRSVAAAFTDVARQVTDWGAPAPVQGWQARDVVGHLVEWFPPFLAAGDVELPAGPGLDAPVAAWEHQAGAVQDLLDDPSTAERSFSHPRIPSQPLASAIDSFYTVDVFMHTWDLARAAAIEVDLDPELCTQLVDGMAAIEDLMRDSGQYGPAVPVPADADPQTRLLGFIGRDPQWQPGT